MAAAPLKMLAGIMDAIRAEPGFKEACRKTLQDILLPELPQSRRNDLIPDEEAEAELAQQLAETGSQRMLALMKGAS